MLWCPSKKYIYYTLLFIGFTFKSYGQYTEVINTNRPGVTIGAFGVSKSVFQIEYGFQGISSTHSVKNYKANSNQYELDIRKGVLKDNLELFINARFTESDSTINRLSTSYRRQVSDLSELRIGLKYLLWDPYKRTNLGERNIYSWRANKVIRLRNFIPSIALWASTSFNIEGNAFMNYPSVSKFSPAAGIITQSQLNDYWTWTNNVFVFNLLDKPAFYYDFRSSIIKGFKNSRWSIFIEQNTIYGDQYADLILRSGVAYLSYENLQFDLYAGYNVKSTPRLLSVGFGGSFRIDRSDQKRLKTRY